MPAADYGGRLRCDVIKSNSKFAISAALSCSVECGSQRKLPSAGKGGRRFNTPLPRAVPVFLPVAIRFHHQLAQGVEVATANGRANSWILGEDAHGLSGTSVVWAKGISNCGGGRAGSTRGLSRELRDCRRGGPVRLG